MFSTIPFFSVYDNWPTNLYLQINVIEHPGIILSSPSFLGFGKLIITFSRNKKGKREYLNDSLTSDLSRKLNGFFESKVDVPRIMYGKRQTIETLINEEALLLAKYLRGETESWIPRTPFLLTRTQN